MTALYYAVKLWISSSEKFLSCSNLENKQKVHVSLAKCLKIRKIKVEHYNHSIFSFIHFLFKYLVSIQIFNCLINAVILKFVYCQLKSTQYDQLSFRYLLIHKISSISLSLFCNFFVDEARFLCAGPPRVFILLHLCGIL